MPPPLLPLPLLLRANEHESYYHDFLQTNLPFLLPRASSSSSSPFPSILLLPPLLSLH